MTQRLRRKVCSLTIGIVCGTLILSGLAWHLYEVLTVTDHAERGLHAAHIVTRAIIQYVETNQGKWPTSWEELETVTVSPSPMYSWPQDSGIIQRYVYIDFQVTSEKLARQPRGEFDAIKPIGPHYPSYDLFFDDLIETVREMEGVKKGRKAQK